jgi:hypothetical protein
MQVRNNHGLRSTEIERLHLRLMLKVGNRRRQGGGIEPIFISLKQELDRLCRGEPRRFLQVRRGWRYF